MAWWFPSLTGLSATSQGTQDEVDRRKAGGGRWPGAGWWWILASNKKTLKKTRVAGGIQILFLVNALMNASHSTKNHNFCCHINESIHFCRQNQHVLLVEKDLHKMCMSAQSPPQREDFKLTQLDSKCRVNWKFLEMGKVSSTQFPRKSPAW